MYAEDYDEDGAPVDEQYFDDYGDISVHETMLGDRPRMKFYSDVISDPATGIKGSLVVDVGAGSGILSAWAVSLGSAAHVVAIEASSLAESVLPATLVKVCADRFTVVHSTVNAIVELGPERFLTRFPQVAALLRSGHRFGFVLSEWMGFYLVHECMLPSVILARDFFARLNELYGGSCPQMIPSHAQLFASPMTAAPMYAEARRRYSGRSGTRDQDPLLRGVDLSHVGTAITSRKFSGPNPLIIGVSDKCVLCPTVLLSNRADDDADDHLELDSITVDEALRLERRCTIAFDSPSVKQWLVEAEANTLLSTSVAPSKEEADRPVVVDGFVIWFQVSFGAHVLSTGPGDTATHWLQTVVMLPEEVRSDPSSELRLSTLVNDKALMTILVTMSCHDTQRRQYTIDVELEDDSGASTST